MTGDVAPRATYRLQLGPDLDFHAAAELAGYLASLGVTHLYCSPVLQARAGSTHGYDVADPTRLSEALGGEVGFGQLVDAARAHGLGVVVDVVPNHLGTSADNPLWESLLAEGPSGEGAACFDVDWSPALPGAEDKVVLPVLGTPYAQALHAGELAVVDDGRGPRVRYHDHSLPLTPDSRRALARDDVPLEGVPGRPETWARLHALLEAQHYRLVHWRVGDALVNYRRFFAIGELAAVRVEDPAVFDRTHVKVLDLVRSGAVEGLRLDHIDGLADPAGYLDLLRAATGEDTWIVVEKILGPGEELPAWPVEGTTGYDFLADVLGLFVDPSAERPLTDVAHAFDAWPEVGLEAEHCRARREVLEADLEADSERLVDRFWALTQRHLEVRDVTRRACRAALVATLAALDVYRVYTRPGVAAAAGEVARVRAAVTAARGQAPDVPPWLWGFLEAFLCGRVAGDALHAETLRRFHQVASAATAKGVEDTLLYRQHRLTALNEVGAEPERFGSAVSAFHAANARRAERHPQGLLTTATHDTKRGEDVRLRIAALTEVPELWAAAVGHWRDRNRALTSQTGGVPDPATEYLCYQTLVGVWPPSGAPDLDELRRRVGDYLVKATREDGRRTSWVQPDEAYEAGLATFVGRLLDPRTGSWFLDELAAITQRTGEIAMVSSLSQVLLRSTSPGAADTYQGNEVWEDSLVDPDNRRPVDFAARRRLLDALDAGPADLAELLEHRADGRLKLWVLSRALRARASHPACFGPRAGYEPLAVEGRFADHVVAFARTSPGGGAAAVVVAPRLVGRLIGDRASPPTGEAWADSRLVLPGGLGRRRWIDELGGPGGQAGEHLDLARILADLPVALLLG